MPRRHGSQGVPRHTAAPGTVLCRAVLCRATRLLPASFVRFCLPAAARCSRGEGGRRRQRQPRRRDAPPPASSGHRAGMGGQGRGQGPRGFLHRGGVPSPGCIPPPWGSLPRQPRRGKTGLYSPCLRRSPGPSRQPAGPCAPSAAVTSRRAPPVPPPPSPGSAGAAEARLGRADQRPGACPRRGWSWGWGWRSCRSLQSLPGRLSSGAAGGRNLVLVPEKPAGRGCLWQPPGVPRCTVLWARR